MDLKEALHRFAQLVGPEEADDEELEELGLENLESAIQYITDEQDDGETAYWSEEMKEVVKVIMAHKHLEGQHGKTN